MTSKESLKWPSQRMIQHARHAGLLPLKREEFWGVSRSAERRVQDVHERWRDELTTQKNRAFSEFQ